MAPYVYVYPLGTGPSAPRRPQGVIVDPCFCVPDLMVMEIELKFSDRRNITDRDFVIRDVNENMLFRVKEPEYRLNGKKTLLDYSGSPILTLRPSSRVVNFNWQVFRGESKEQHDLLFTTQLTGLWDIKVFLAHNEEKKRCDFRVKASRTQFDRTCVIYAGESDTIVAQMHQKHTLKSLVLIRDIISVTVNPNVDYAFITSLIVIFDDVTWTYFDKLRFTGRIVYTAASLFIHPLAIVKNQLFG